MAYYPKKKQYSPPHWAKKKGPEIIPGSQYKPLLTPSSEQQAIFDAVLDGNDSLMVDAYAGCGKTSTCVEAAHRALKKNPKLQMAYIIFAKKNKDEAVGKMPPEMQTSTAHAFGLKIISSAFGKVTVDKEKTERIALSLVGPDDDKSELRYMMAKAIDLAKDYMATDESTIMAMCDKHGIERGNLSESEFASKVLSGMETSAKQPNIVSFSDMVWLPLKLGLTVPTYSVVFLDEAQDLNNSRIELALRTVGEKGRMVVVGDQNQAIFGFSGADRHALTKLRERTNAVSFPLHRTYRCGKNIVEYAKQYVPDYEAAESNPDGEVLNVNNADLMDPVRGGMPGDCVLSRTNAPLVKIAMQFLKERRKVFIQGRDLGSNLIFMIKRSKTKDVPSFQSWLGNWASAEIERLTAKNPNANVDFIQDKCSTLEAFCEGTRNLDEVRSNISAMFDDGESNEEHRVVCSTVHSFKGLQRNRSWILQNSFVVRPKTADDIEQEKNVKYVGATRSVDQLNLVSGDI